MPSLERDSHRIVIAGTSSLLGAELRPLLEESRFAGCDFRLVDEEAAAGTLMEAGGEAAVIQPAGERERGQAWGEIIRMKKSRWCMFLLVVLMPIGCGYRVAGRSNSLPKSIHVIAVPALENKTSSYRIEQKLTAATVHEFLAKTQYKVTSNPANGDAVLRGTVMSVEAVPLLFDTATGRATTMLVTVKCTISLTDALTQKALYQTDNFLFRNEYEISTNVKSFFEEQDPALDRLAQDFATRLVAAVIENY